MKDSASSGSIFRTVLQKSAMLRMISRRISSDILMDGAVRAGGDGTTALGSGHPGHEEQIPRVVLQLLGELAQAFHDLVHVVALFEQHHLLGGEELEEDAAEDRHLVASVHEPSPPAEAIVHAEVHDLHVAG